MQTSANLSCSLVNRVPLPPWRCRLSVIPLFAVINIISSLRELQLSRETLGEQLTPRKLIWLTGQTLCDDMCAILYIIIISFGVLLATQPCRHSKSARNSLHSGCGHCPSIHLAGTPCHSSIHLGHLVAGREIAANEQSDRRTDMVTQKAGDHITSWRS